MNDGRKCSHGNLIENCCLGFAHAAHFDQTFQDLVEAEKQEKFNLQELKLDNFKSDKFARVQEGEEKLLEQELYQFAVENIFRALEHAFENLAQQQREKDYIRQSKFFANELELSLHGKPAVRVSQTIKDKSCTFTGVYNFHEDARHQLLILDSPKSGVHAFEFQPYKQLWQSVAN